MATTIVHMYYLHKYVFCMYICINNVEEFVLRPTHAHMYLKDKKQEKLLMLTRAEQIVF